MKYHITLDNLVPDSYNYTTYCLHLA